MIPLVLAIAFAFISFIASAFILLRIVIPILPPHPLSRRASPVEFGLPTFRMLSPADQIHVWLASLDLIALAFFLWETAVETTGGASGFASAADPVSSTRYSVFLTIRQIFLLVVTGIILLHIRLNCPISFGKCHWTIWAPSLAFILTSAALSGVVSGAGINTLFYGLVAYNSAIMVASIVAFSCLIGTSLVIKRNLNAIDAKINPCQPVREEKPRPSFAANDIEALREGGSGISSNSSANSRHTSLSAWPFSTQQTTSGSSPNHGRSPLGGRHFVPAKASYRVGNPCEDIPPVPPLPSKYSQISPTAGTMALGERDPFHGVTPSSASVHPRFRLGSQTSWLTSASGSRVTMSAWSLSTREPSLYSASMHDIRAPTGTVSRPNTPVLENAQDLGEYSYASNEVEKESTAPYMDFDVSISRNLGWFFLILVPYAFSLPYLIIASRERSPPFIASTLFMLSITLSSPILAFNVLFKCPFPILFHASTHLPADLREPKDNHTLPHWSYEYKRSMGTGVRVVEDRRSGDVWIAKGDAVDGKGKLGRALEVLNPRPKLSVIPPQETPKLPPLTPSLPIQDEDSLPVIVCNSPETGTQFGHRRSESKPSSRSSSREEDPIVASRIMTAHRHYSVLAQTIVVPGTSLGKREGKPSAMVTTRPGHPRARSMSLVSGPVTPAPSNGTIKSNPTPPPSFPLPPTPPSVRATRLALAHKRSASSRFDLRPDGGINEIDTLTAGFLTSLVPGLKIGGNMTTQDDGNSTLGNYSKSQELKMKMTENDFDFPSQMSCSTPERRLHNKKSQHRRNRYGHLRYAFLLTFCSPLTSAHSLGLGKDGGGDYTPTSMDTDIRKVIERKATQFRYSAAPNNGQVGWRNTVYDAKPIPDAVPCHRVPLEIEPETFKLVRSATLKLHLDIPQVDSARPSLLGMINFVSMASSATLSDDIKDDFGCGPLTESTPHHTVTEKKIRTQAPPPLRLAKPIRTCSSIAHIGPEDLDSANITAPGTESTTASAMAPIGQWSSQVVGPQIPKASKVESRISNVSSLVFGVKYDSPKTGLRHPMLLQDRIPNTTSLYHHTRPLNFDKKRKSRRAAGAARDENTSLTFVLA